MRLELRKRELLPLAGALIVSLVAAGVVWGTWREATDAEERLQHYTGLILTTTRVLAGMLEAETAQRGYLLTGDRAYLVAYGAAERSVPSLLKDLQGNRITQPLEKAELLEIERLVTERLAKLSDVLKVYESGGLSAASPLLPAGKAVMDDLRFEVQRLQQSWLTNAAAQSDRVKSASLASLLIAIGGSVGTATLMLLAAWQLNRSLRDTRAALARVKEGEERYQLLAGRLQQIREEESGQLARRVHDDLGQAMTAIRFDLSALARRLEKQSSELHGMVRATIALTDEAVKTVRNIAIDLRPGVLDQLGLVAALEWSGMEFQKRYGAKVLMKADVDTVDAPREQQLALFRIAQEAMTNIARHANATQVTLAVRVSDDRLVLEVIDNGVGIPPEKLEHSRTVGLLSMQERARLAGATWQATSTPGAGTTIRVILPLQGGHGSDHAQARAGSG
jgi:signal transduction histidine kinase